jgi:tripartite-type tricarboxylate transporter receptor subunit TctC
MEIFRRHLAALALGLVARPALAQPAFPNRSIRLIVGFAPGGATDIQSRIIAARLQMELGQPVVVENRGGASGIIGTEAAAHAAPDGYTLTMGSITTHAVNVPMYGAKLSYDPLKDFVPVTRVSTGYNVLVVHPDVPARNTAELVALARARPGRLAYGSGGNGTSTHLAGEMFKTAAGIDLLQVPFRSTAPATTALMANEIQVMFDTTVSALPLVQQGRLRLLATCAPQRRPAMPEVPAVAEALPGFEMGTWSGLFAPAGTPPAIVARIDAAMQVTMRDPDLLARFASLGTETFYAGPEEFAAFIGTEITRWTTVVRDAGITAE